MSQPHLLSIQVGKPQERDTASPWTSGIFKFPVYSPIHLGKLNLDGDGQADLKNHGGEHRPVLMYNAEHYSIWRVELDKPDLPYGAFGENFTVSELNEKNVCIGDIYQIGDVQVQVSQPRMPCWKLARRWDIKDLTKLVHERAWGGWYLRVLQEGMVEAGTPITRLERTYPEYTVDFVFSLMNKWINDPDSCADLSEIEALSPGWREAFAKRVTDTV